MPVNVGVPAGIDQKSIACLDAIRTFFIKYSKDDFVISLETTRPKEKDIQVVGMIEAKKKGLLVNCYPNATTIKIALPYDSVYGSRDGSAAYGVMEIIDPTNKDVSIKEELQLYYDLFRLLTKYIAPSPSWGSRFISRATRCFKGSNRLASCTCGHASYVDGNCAPCLARRIDDLFDTEDTF